MLSTFLGVYADKTTSEIEIQKTLIKNAAKISMDFYRSTTEENFDKAISEWKTILKDDPENIDAQINIGMLYNKKVGLIIKKLETVKLPKAGNYFALGNLCLAGNQFDKAIKLYDKAIEAAPKWGCPRRHKGEALLKAGKNAEALTCLEECVKVRWNHFDAHVYLAHAYILNENLEKAEKSLEEAIKIFNKGKACTDDKGEPEAELSDCYRYYVEIYTKTGNKEKLELYKSKLEKLKK